VSSDDFSVHLKVGNNRLGFLNGSIYEHAPIFWSKLFFCNTAAENGKNWSSRVTIQNAPENVQGDACETRIGVEPFTGQIMSGTSSFCSVMLYCFPLSRDRYARKRMQTNLYVPAVDEAPSLFNFYNKNMYRGPSKSDGYMMPLFYIDEHGQISPDDAELFKAQVRIPP
jgi:hypothetical protein